LIGLKLKDEDIEEIGY